MVTGDTLAARGTEGAFSATLRGFHVFWERIDIVCPYLQGGGTLHPSHSNIFFHSIPPFRVVAPLYVFIRGLFLCRAHKPNLIIAHAYGPQLMSCGAWLLSRVTGVPLIIEVHHIDGYPHAANMKERVFHILSVAFFRMVKNDVRLFRAVSAAGADALHSLVIPSSKIKIIPSMYIDHCVFRPIAGVLKEYEMIFVGRLASNKGLERMLAVFATVRRAMPSARLLIIGSGPEGRWLMKKIAGNPHIVHIGRVPSADDMAALYNRARVAICASFSEGGPRFTVEAMACGVPVVTTRVGLMGEIVRNGENGFLVDPWSADMAADCVLRILRSGAQYTHYSEHAVRAVARFRYSDAIAAYARAYHDAIGI